MRRSPKLLAQIAAVGFVVSVTAVWVQPTVAHMVPETLADARPVQAGPVEPGFPIDYLGVLWDVPGGPDHAADGRAAESNGAVRFRHGGAWGPWIRLIEDGIEAEGQWASGLVPGGDADAYQVRGIAAEAVDPQAVAINTTDGPLVKVGEEQGAAAHAVDSSKCRSRADWGADESLRFDDQGNEVWPPDFYGAQVMTVHHTATDNDDPDPEATVRAIYRYHAVDQGWGDIGYQYLIDESGVVYEGRWSGETSTSCETAGGDGSDFGHETPTDLDGDGQTDEMVTAAHTGGWNSGNLGVALLGEFTDHPRFGGEPKAAAVDSLEDVLAESTLRHSLDPLAEVVYVNPVSGEEKTVDTIGGHRDYTATECPGDNLYDRLPTIRQNVADKLAASDGNVAPTASFTYDCTGLGCDFDGSGSSDSDGSISSYAWDFGDGATASGATVSHTYAADGTYTVTLTVADDVGATDSESASVSVSDGSSSTSDTMHVGDLDGVARKAPRGHWEATVAITVLDASGDAVAEADVAGTWTTTGTAATCTTGSDGTCSATSPQVHKSTGSLTFTVDGATHDSLSYDATANTDPDEDSDGTTISVAKSD